MSFLSGFLVLLCIVSALVSSINQAAAYVSLEDELVTTLLAPLNKRARPHVDGAAVMNITIDVSIYSMELLEMEESFEIHFYSKITWEDFRLSWNTSAFPGINYISLKETDIWIPHLFGERTKSVQITPIMCLISPNGTVSLYQTQALKVSCNFDISLYPFDEQLCHVRLLQVGTEMAELVVGKVYTERLGDDPIWRNRDVKAETTHELEELSGSIVNHYILTVDLIRKGTYFWLSTIVPVHSLDILSMAGLWIHISSGEKIGFHVNILLTCFVFFILVLGHIPRSSEQIALMSGYSSVILLRVFINLLLTIITAGIETSHHQSGPPLWIVRIFWLQNDEVFTNSSKVTPTSEEDSSAVATTGSNLRFDNFNGQWTAVARRIERIAFACCVLSSVGIILVLMSLTT